MTGFQLDRVSGGEGIGRFDGLDRSEVRRSVQLCLFSFALFWPSFGLVYSIRVK